MPDAAAAAEGISGMTLGQFIWENRAPLLSNPREWWRLPRVQKAWESFLRSRQRRFKRAAKDPSAWAWDDSAALYRTLRLPRSATFAEVRSAHRKLALELHPDRLPPGATDAERAAATEAFQVMQDAYQELADREAASSTSKTKRVRRR